MLRDDEVLARHRRQLWGPYPYEVHLRAVQTVALAIDPSPLIASLALRHDLLEDTETSLKELPEELHKPLLLLSRNHSQRGLTYKDYIRLIANSGDRPAMVVKLADAIANWTLCEALGDSERGKRYASASCILYTPVFRRPPDKTRVQELSSLVALPEDSL